jgi:hypothetical protein
MHKMFKNSVRASKKSQHNSITGVSWILFKEIIAFYSDNYRKPIAYIDSVGKI